MRNMHFYDEYEVEQPQTCPGCGDQITGWEGRDGPRKLLTFRQGQSEPDALWQGIEPLSKADLTVRLPNRFRLQGFCRCSRLPILAEGECENGVWVSTTITGVQPTVATEDAMRRLIEEQLADIRDAAVLQRIRTHLVRPELHLRNWDHSFDDVTYACWWVARFPESNMALIYSEYRCYNWGCVELDQNWFGMDSQWYPSLEEAHGLVP